MSTTESVYNYSENESYSEYEYEEEMEHARLVNGTPAYGEEFGKCQDVAFVILFALHVVGFVVAVAALWSDTVVARGEVKGEAAKFVDKGMIPLFVGACCIAVVYGLAWLVLMRAAGGVLIPVCMVLYIVLLVLLGIVLAAAGQYIFAILVVLLAGLYAFFFYRWRDRIPFSKAMLTSATTWVFAHTASLALSAATLVVLVVYVLFAVTVATAPISRGMDTMADFGVMVFILFSIYWTTQVLRNVLHTSIAGATGAWYFESNAAKGIAPSSPLLSAFKRAVTTSFGPIAFGSFVVAVLKTFRSVLRIVLHSAGSRGFMACIINMILSCIESLMELFNVYAFTYVALYGRSYIHAAKDVWALLNSNGIALIINENLTGLVFFFGSLSGALVTGGACAGYAASSSAIEGEYSWVTALIVGLIIGFVVVSQIMEVPDSHIAALFVSLAEEPALLPTVDPVLAEAFRASYPNLIPVSAYRNQRAARRG